MLEMRVNKRLVYNKHKQVHCKLYRLCWSLFALSCADHENDKTRQRVYGHAWSHKCPYELNEVSQHANTLTSKLTYFIVPFVQVCEIQCASQMTDKLTVKQNTF